MDEDDRRHLYTTLLRGIANEAQDRMCAADKQHAWGPWEQTALRHDRPLLPVSLADMPVAMNEIVRIKSERTCLNCGKFEIR